METRVSGHTVYCGSEPRESAASVLQLLCTATAFAASAAKAPNILCAVQSMYLSCTTGNERATVNLHLETDRPPQVWGYKHVDESEHFRGPRKVGSVRSLMHPGSSTLNAPLRY
jgi:hypothetical protein